MAKRIAGPSDEVSNYLACLLLHLALPLLPLLLEVLVKNGAISASTVAITAAMYSIAIGLSSRNTAMFGLCIVVGIIYSALFGMVIAAPEAMPWVSRASGVSIFLVFLVHAAERYNRHVVDCSPFFEFSNGVRK